MALIDQAHAVSYKLPFNGYLYTVNLQQRGWIMFRSTPDFVEILTVEGWENTVVGRNSSYNYHDTAKDAFDAIEQLG